MGRIGLVALIAVPTGFFAWLMRRGAARSARFEAQLGDTLTTLAGALRSGSSSMESIGIVAAKAPSPTAEEFQRVIAEVRIGRDLVASLDDLADRMQSEDARWFIEAVALNRELGGNLATTLDRVGETIRARAEVKSQVAVMSAEGRLTAGILLSLPFVIALILQVLNPGYLLPLVEKSAGNLILAGALANMAVGAIWIRKLIQMEY